MSEQATAFQPTWISPPGETILDLLEEKGWTRRDLAVRLGYTEKRVSQILTGQVALTEDTALGLERVLGSTADFWLARDARYRQRTARRA